MKIGITGHQKLENPSSWGWVRREIDSILAQASKPFIGVTSLAIGADQLFAEAVLQCGESLNVIVPLDEYELKFSEGYERQRYWYFLSKATKVKVLVKMNSDEEAYFEAGKQVVNTVNLLIAVWNGEPARGLGGTADVVEYAKQRNGRIVHLNPITHQVTYIQG